MTQTLLKRFSVLKSKRGLALLLLLILFAGAVLPNIHQGSLINSDDALYAQVMREASHETMGSLTYPTRFMLVRMLTGLIQVYSHADRERADALTGFRDALFRNYARV